MPIRYAGSISYCFLARFFCERCAMLRFTLLNSLGSLLREKRYMNLNQFERHTKRARKIWLEEEKQRVHSVHCLIAVRSNLTRRVRRSMLKTQTWHRFPSLKEEHTMPSCCCSYLIRFMHYKWCITYNSRAHKTKSISINTTKDTINNVFYETRHTHHPNFKDRVYFPFFSVVFFFVVVACFESRREENKSMHSTPHWSHLKLSIFPFDVSISDEPIPTIFRNFMIICTLRSCESHTIYL